MSNYFRELGCGCILTYARLRGKKTKLNALSNYQEIKIEGFMLSFSSMSEKVTLNKTMLAAKWICAFLWVMVMKRGQPTCRA